MEARFSLPAAIGLAMALGLAMSTIVPTRMVTADAPPWSGTAAAHEPFDRDATYQFAEAPPQDLDPSVPVGPQYEFEDDEVPLIGPVNLNAPAEDPGPIFVSVEYGFNSRPQDPASSEVPINEPPAQPELTPLPPQMEAAIY